MFEFKKIDDTARERLMIIGPEIDKYWDSMIQFLAGDPYGTLIVQLIACYVGGKQKFSSLDIVPVGYPRATLTGFAGEKGRVGQVKAEYGIVGNQKIFGSQDLDPAKPADVGTAIISYFGRYYGLFAPGSAQSGQANIGTHLPR